MHVIVVGCGRVGSRLAIELIETGHTVAVIDKNEAAFRRLPAGWGGTEVVGASFDRDRLEAAGADQAGALAAVTSGDNSNILTARIARETYDIPAVVARIYDPRRAEIYQRLGIPTVATVTWTIGQVLRKLFPERSSYEWSDPSGGVRLIERVLPPSWCGRRFTTIEEQAGARVVAVTRGGVSELGPGELVGQQGDIVYFVVDEASARKLDDALSEAEGDITRRVG